MRMQKKGRLHLRENASWRYFDDENDELTTGLENRKRRAMVESRIEESERADEYYADLGDEYLSERA